MRRSGRIETRRIPMALIVHKYGGTSMGSPERIQNVARRVAKWVARRAIRWSSSPRR